jgi:hypothetical protein
MNTLTTLQETGYKEVLKYYQNNILYTSVAYLGQMQHINHINDDEVEHIFKLPSIINRDLALLNRTQQELALLLEEQSPAAILIAEIAVENARRGFEIQQSFGSILPNNIKSIMRPEKDIDTLFKLQIEYNKIDRDYIQLFDELTAKYIENSYKFVEMNDQNTVFAILNNKYNLFFNKEPSNIPTIKHVIGNSIASLFGRYLLFNQDMRFNDNSDYYVANYILVPDESNNSFTLDRQLGIDIGGLRRDFITSIINELFEKKIFIKSEDTNKYFLNPNFKMDKEFKFVVNDIMPSFIDTNQYKLFYNFIGYLLTFLLVNKCGITHNISSYIIANFYTPDISSLTDIDYVYFMFQDFPQFCNLIINLMKDPKNIEYTYISFNDYYKLIATDKDITADNIQEYLILVSKFTMTKTILRKGIDITLDISQYDTFIKYAENIHKWLIAGIPMEIKTQLHSSDFNSNIINSYLVIPAMTYEIINDLIKNFRKTMGKKIETTYNQDKKDVYVNFTNIFIKYILTYNSLHLSEIDYFIFITNLVRFWSGSSFFNNNEDYKIEINYGLSIHHLPQSHTCFYTIDLPKYDGPNNIEIGNIIYNKLYMAVTNVEQGIGFRGGYTPRRRVGISKQK